LLTNEQAAADVTEAVHCHVADWSKAALTSLQRHRIDKIAVVSLDIIFLDHAYFRSSTVQVTVAHLFAVFNVAFLQFLVYLASSSYSSSISN